MSIFKQKINPRTGQFNLILDTALLKLKGTVPTVNDLPLTGNSENDCYVVKSNDSMYTWNSSSSSGELTDWINVGNASEVDWNNISGKPDFAQLHDQNTDNTLIQANEEILDQQQTTGTSAKEAQNEGQTFTVERTGLLSKIILKGYCQNPDTLTVNIEEVTNELPNGNVLATVNISSDNIPSESGEFDVIFNIPASVISGVMYAVTFSSSGEVELIKNNTNVYSGGSRVTGGAGSWSKVAEDYYFETYVTINETELINNGLLKSDLDVASGIKIDGRDLSVDGTKLDGIEDGATADQVASEIPTDETGITVQESLDNKEPLGAVSTHEGTYDHSQLAGLAGTINKLFYNLMLGFFKLAVQGSLIKFNLLDGLMDEFEDETGVDTDTSENQDYDSSNDLYKPTATDNLKDSRDVVVDNRVGLSKTGQSLLAYPFTPTENYDLSKIAVQLRKVNSPTGNMWVEIYSDNGSGDPLTQIGIDSSALDVSGISTSDTYYTFTFTTPISLTLGTKYWIVLNDDRGVDNTNYIEWCGNVEVLTARGHYYDDAVWSYWNDVNFNFKTYNTIFNNMTLISLATIAEEAPTQSRIVIMEEDVDSITLNTDLKAYISRNNGSNWTQHTLTDEGDYDTGKRILVSDAVDISGQPSGTQMKWKITTHNNKDLKLHCVGVNW